MTTSYAPTISSLRRDAPTWTWSAERHGLDWRYVGERGGCTVRVYATAVLCGPAEDYAHTIWRADDGDTACSLSYWLAHQVKPFSTENPRSDR